MICEQTQELITGLVDNQLTVEERRAVDGHLNECRNCQITYRNEMALKKYLRGAGASLEVPAELRDRIRSLAETQVPDASSEGMKPQPREWFSLAGFRPAVAWAALVIVVVPLVYFWWPAQNISLAALETHEHILAGNVAFLKAENLADLEKQMARAVESRFAPMGYDFSMIKLRPVAGLIQKTADRQILVISYTGENPAITCFTFLGTEKDAPHDATLFFDAVKQIEFLTFSRRGVNGVLHREGNIICILVSKMPMAKLLEIARAKARPA